MNLQLGDYIALEGLTKKQVESVIEKMYEAGFRFYGERYDDHKFLLLHRQSSISAVYDISGFFSSDQARKLTIEQVLGVQSSSDKNSKYDVEVNGTTLDVYDVLKAWNVTNPALQHLIKKALQAGSRGHKTLDQDMDDIVASAIRARELAK